MHTHTLMESRTITRRSLQSGHSSSKYRPSRGLEPPSRRPLVFVGTCAGASACICAGGQRHPSLQGTAPTFLLLLLLLLQGLAAQRAEARGVYPRRRRQNERKGCRESRAGRREREGERTGATVSPPIFTEVSPDRTAQVRCSMHHARAHTHKSKMSAGAE